MSWAIRVKIDKLTSILHLWAQIKFCPLNG